MVAAMTAHVRLFLKLALEEHCAATGALFPEIVRDLFLGANQAPDLWTDEGCKPSSSWKRVLMHFRDLAKEEMKKAMMCENVF